MDKSKIIFIGIIALVFIFIVFYSISLLSGGGSKDVRSEFHVPDVVKGESKDSYNSRLAKANMHRNPKADDKLSSSVDFKVYQSDSILPVDIHTEEDILPVEPKPSPTAKPKSSSNRSVVSRPKAAAQNTPPVQTTIVGQSNTESSNANPGGFGIVRNQSVATSSDKDVSPNNDFFPVMLESAVTVKDNSNVVFILLNDLEIGGNIFKKNSFAFGKSKIQNHFFDVHIYQIKNTDGRMYNVEKLNLHIFDENYSRGFKFEGNLNEGVREGAVEGIASTSATSYGVVDASARIVDRVISNVTRKKDPTVSLLRGYRIYLKTTND